MAAEAKGNIRQSNTQATIVTTANNGYSGQVAPHIGKVLNKSTVLHGYAVAIGGPPTSTPVSMHVVETGSESIRWSRWPAADACRRGFAPQSPRCPSPMPGSRWQLPLGVPAHECRRRDSSDRRRTAGLAA